MQAIVIAVVTTVIGVVVTILISRHYYGRSSKHRLAIYEFPFPKILRGVDPETRRGLAIKFHGRDVNELNVIEYLIANEGADAIRDTISPLSAAVAEPCQIVDASITYVWPEGREVSVEVINDRQFRCVFPLLNSHEYFYIKLITDGYVRGQDITFSITAEDLPPRIRVESGARVNISGEDSRFSDVGAFGGALVILLIGASIGIPVVGLYEVHPAYFPFAWSRFQFTWWLTVPLAIATITSVMILISSFTIAATAIFGSIPRRPNFRRPGKHGSRFYGFGYPVGPFEEESVAVRYPREND